MSSLPPNNNNTSTTNNSNSTPSNATNVEPKKTQPSITLTKALSGSVPAPTGYGAFGIESENSSRSSVTNSAKVGNIEEQLPIVNFDNQPVPKLCIAILGASNSGKSTCLKQLESYYEAIYQSQVTSPMEGFRMVSETVSTLIREISNALLAMEGQIPMSSMKRRGSVVKPEPCAHLSADEKIKLGILLGDARLADILNDPIKYNISEAVAYWFPNRAREVIKDGYEPSEEDLLNVHNPTTMITYRDLLNERLSLKVMDLPGSRLYRSTWVSHYEEAELLFFCVSLTSYMYKTSADNDTTLMHDSLSLFEAVVNHKTNEKKRCVLFLSKQDLFEKYLPFYPVSDAFPEYQGENSISNVLVFIISRFKNRLHKMTEKTKGRFQAHICEFTNRSKFSLILKHVEKLCISACTNSTNNITNKLGNCSISSSNVAATANSTEKPSNENNEKSNNNANINSNAANAIQSGVLSSAPATIVPEQQPKRRLSFMRF